MLPHVPVVMLLDEFVAEEEEEDVDALLAAVDAQIHRTWGNPQGPRSRSVPLDVGAAPAPSPEDRLAARRRQYATLGLLVVVGCANKVLGKIVTLPMANYPNALNLLTTAVYVPLSYAYIVPIARARPKWITPAHRRLPCAPFATMGALDAVAGTAQVFATTFLPGALVVLLLQFAIPVSMALSRTMLGARYAPDQGAGALLTTVGVFVAIGPALANGGSDAPGSARGRSLLWGLVLLASCVPMCLSSIYKEIRLKDHDLDAVFLNGRIAVFQLLFSIPLALPLAAVSAPPVDPGDLPGNLADGLRCVGGRDAETCADGLEGCAVDNCWPRAPTFVSMYIVVNVAYNILVILMLKYGDANLLWLAMTLLVPLSTVSYASPNGDYHTYS